MYLSANPLAPTALRVGAIVLILTSFATGCVSDEWGLDESSGAFDPRLDELRARLNITINTDGVPDCDGRVCTPANFALNAYLGCTAPGYTAGTSGTCRAEGINAHKLVCTAQTLLRVAQARGVEEVDYGELSMQVPPQDAESQAELARLARTFALEAGRTALNALNLSTCSTTDMNGALGSESPAAERTVGGNLAHLVRTSFHLTRESDDLLERYSMGVSDAQHARATDHAIAEYAELAPFASRAAAAHSLLGGAHGLPALRGVSEVGFYPAGRLSGEAQVALAFLRQSGVSPARVLDSGNTIDDVVYGESLCDGMRMRLAMMDGRDDLRTADDADVVYRQLGVSREAFVEARAYLAAEIHAFHRSQSFEMPNELLGNGETTDSVTIPAESEPMSGSCAMPIYASTRNPPVQPLPTWWSAILRFDPSPAVMISAATDTTPAWIWGAGTSGVAQIPSGSFTFGEEVNTATTGFVTLPSGTPESGPAGLTTAGALESYSTRVRAVDARIAALGSPTAGSDLARELLAETMADIGRSPFGDEVSVAPIGRARLCAGGTETGTWVNLRVDFEVPGLGLPESMDDYIVVSRHEALDCAVRGAVEGAPCDAATIASAQSDVAWDDNGPRIEGLFEQATDVWDDDQSNDGVRAFFLLRRRQGTTTSDVVPGTYEPIAGWTLEAPEDETYNSCYSVVLSPGLELEATRIISPSTSFIGVGDISCAGLPTDMRIPLENELTDDGNGIESSWRHYLDLARRAADEADFIGESLIDQGLQMDLRAEAAVDELERICGVRINVSPTQAVPRTETVMSGASCTDGYFKESSADTICYLDPVQYAISRATSEADAAALRRCLGASDEALDQSYLAMGDTPLCFWQLTEDPNSFCENEEGGELECPTLAAGPRDNPTCPADAVPAGAFADYVVPQDRLLQLFHIPAESPPPPPLDPGDLPCASLAAMRANAAAMTPLQGYQLISSRFLQHESFSQTARSLKWVTSAGDYSRVLSNNAIVASTGAPGLTTETRWPMGAAPFSWTCPESLDGFTPPSTGTGPAWGSTAAAVSALATYTGPLGCVRNMETIASGVPDSDARQLRARLNDMLGRAVVTAHVITGTTLEGSRIPFQPDQLNCEGGDDWVRVEGEDYAPIGSSVEESNIGEFIFDHAPDSDEDGDRYDFGDIHMLAQWVDDESEWAVCPYTFTGSCPGQDFEVGQGTRRPLPFLAVELGSSDRVNGSRSEAATLWEEGGWVRNTLAAYVFGESLPFGLHDALRVLPGSRGPVTLDKLSRYTDASLRHGDACWHRGYTDYFVRNDAAVGRRTMTTRDMLNALELTCMAAQSSQPNPIDYGCNTAVTISSVNDLLEAGDEMHCLANGVSNDSARTIIRGLPTSLAEDIRRNSGVVHGSGEGEYGVQVASIRAALLELQAEEAAIATAVHSFGTAIDDARAIVRRHEIGGQIQDLQLASAVSGQITRCIVAVAQAASQIKLESLGSIGANVAMAGSTCIDSGIQIALATVINDLEGQQGAIDIQLALSRVDEQFRQTAQAIREHAANARSAFARIDAAATALRNEQGRARTAMARALFLDSSATGEHFAVDAAMNRRYSITLARYEEAHTRAIRTAYIARLALQQRLGVNLSEMSDDMVTVPAPSGWADELCTMTPIDYRQLNGTSEVPLPDNYAGFHVGDYVDRLEQVFESYSFAYPFQAGTDEVVISLRDDLNPMTMACDGEVPNLLYHTNTLRFRAGSDGVGWQSLDCPTDTTCITTEDGSVDAPPDVAGASSLVHFTDDAVDDARFAQVVDLPVGRYRLSWYKNFSAGGIDAVRAGPVGGGAAFDIMGTGPVGEHAWDDWFRWSYLFDVTEPGPVEVRILPPSSVPGDVVIAGIQLEVADPIFQTNLGAYWGETMLVPEAAFPPGPFYPTDGDRLGRIYECADDGTEFRQRAFLPGCVRACSDGYDGTCREEDAIQRCYRETQVDIDADILSRLANRPAGFAAGNYNYRIESVGVNLVGTGLRDCGGAGRPGCFGSGNYAYSMLHGAPFHVRNAFGALAPVGIFPGRIESARALAAERYLTNPLSSADQSLIEPYMRREMIGRPMSGVLALRLWDDETFRFDRLEDIQLIIRYRYWTHQR